MVNLATDKYTANKILNLEYQNKNRIEKRFNKGDYVFVLDRMQIPGNTRPLKTKATYSVKNRKPSEGFGF